jgi:hypothetical protein
VSTIAVPSDVAVWTRTELDDLRCACGKPSCPRSSRHLAMALRPQCHPSSGSTVFYDGATGQIALSCSTCGIGLVRIQVAWAVPS